MIMERKNKFLSFAKTEGAKFVLYLPRLALRKLSDSSYVYVTRNHAKQAFPSRVKTYSSDHFYCKYNIQ